MVKALAPTPEELATIKQARTLLRAHLPISDLLAEDAPLGSLQPPEDFDGENPAPFLDLTNLKP